jgi:N-acetylgalactosamine kinase
MRAQPSLASTPPEELQRVQRLVRAFARLLGRPPAAIVRAPGRVNLLGEHTDYNGLPVLPMAIDRSVLVAVAPRNDTVVTLHNLAARFPPRRYALTGSIPPYAAGDWGNYSKAAAQGLVRFESTVSWRGADLAVDGTIPSGAGLSSSSALVVANALALLAANGVEVPYATLAELLPVCERYVGTLSGGMDQATSLLASAGHALRIDFFPLRVRAVPLPAAHAIVVCHSLVRAEKSGAARRAYNRRVIECRLACRVLDQVLGSSLPRPLATLGDLGIHFPGRPLGEFVKDLAAKVPEHPLRLAEIAGIIGTSPSQLRLACEIPSDLDDEFVLVSRVRHVLAEAERVCEAEAALHAGDAEKFGRLMDASHASCRDDYDISCDALEELVAIAKEAGAIGARLTGAGFGGCTVNLVQGRALPAFLRRIDAAFYRPRLRPGQRASAHRFVFHAQAGAEVQPWPPSPSRKHHKPHRRS